MLATGARIGEVLALRWRDIDLGARVINVNATIKTESGIGTIGNLSCVPDSSPCPRERP